MESHRKNWNFLRSLVLFLFFALKKLTTSLTGEIICKENMSFIINYYYVLKLYVKFFKILNVKIKTIHNNT